MKLIYLGNLLSFIILKDSSFKVSSFFYIRCLTIYDSLSLIFTMCGFYAVLVIHPMLIHYPPYQKISHVWVRWGLCQLRTYLAYTSRTVSIWTIVIFTLERFICIKFPLWSMRLCTVRNAKIIMGTVLAISMLCNISWIFSFEKVNCIELKLSVCKNRASMLIFRLLDMVMLSVIPAVIIIVCNIIIVLTLRKRRRLSLVAYEDSKNKRRDMKITMQLLMVSTTFTILTIPQCISIIINTYISRRGLKHHLSGKLANFYHISFLLFTLNFSINFVLYCFIGKNFRNAAVNICLCRLPKMKRLRKAIFDTMSNDTKNTTVSRNNTQKNSILQPNNNLVMTALQKEQNPLVLKTSK